MVSVFFSSQGYCPFKAQGKNLQQGSFHCGLILCAIFSIAVLKRLPGDLIPDYRDGVPQNTKHSTGAYNVLLCFRKTTLLFYFVFISFFFVFFFKSKEAYMRLRHSEERLPASLKCHIP